MCKRCYKVSINTCNVDNLDSFMDNLTGMVDLEKNPADHLSS